MAGSFFFYDLETTGVNPRSARIMQFAGQRTDMELQPIGEPYNILVKLSDDILPEPDAIMITGITPQQTQADGITEAAFFELFIKEIASPGTIFVGFNSIRFDDEFIRFGLYRNFFDAYEWQWKDNRSRWDILDVVRTTRALRPDGIEWPFASDGSPSNRLELLTSVNKLSHDAAHDALSDVTATIDVAKLIREKQPKLFDYLLSIRGKRDVQKLVDAPQPFVYVSGRYATEHHKATIAYRIGEHPDNKGALVYDLRHDPAQFLAMTPEQLAEAWKYTRDPEAVRLPVKALQYNRCPAVAPLGVLGDDDKERLSLDMEVVLAHRSVLDAAPEFVGKLHKALDILNKDRTQGAMIIDEQKVDSMLYNGFVADGDKRHFTAVHESSPDKLSDFTQEFRDPRLKELIKLYKARNFGDHLSDEERTWWESFRATRIQSSLPKFAERLQAIAQRPGLTQQQSYLLEELQLYAESILPAEL